MNYGTFMTDVIAFINGGRSLEAIKAFRSATGMGLKEAKDACEAIRSALPDAPQRIGGNDDEFAVFTRYGEHDYEFAQYRADSQSEANNFANAVVNERAETIVVRIVSKSVAVTTRSMKAA